VVDYIYKMYDNVISANDDLNNMVVDGWYIKREFYTPRDKFVILWWRETEGYDQE
jgi:hypothetical protein